MEWKHFLLHSEFAAVQIEVRRTDRLTQSCQPPTPCGMCDILCSDITEDDDNLEGECRMNHNLLADGLFLDEFPFGSFVLLKNNVFKINLIEYLKNLKLNDFNI